MKIIYYKIIKLTKWKILFDKELKYIYSDIKERKEIFFLVAMHLLKCSKTKIYLLLINKKKINYTNNIYFKYFLNKLKEYMPIQYLLGEVFFYNINLKINRNVLIPRKETEELVFWIIKDNFLFKKMNILDIGTGSGCIALSLKKKFYTSKVYAIDSFYKSIKCAKKNAKLNNLDIVFIKKNILKNFPKKLPLFDIIVSNPPYILPSEKKIIHKSILKYEPKTSLFVPENYPLIFYEKISYWALNKLTLNGVIYFEINNFFAKKISFLLKKIGYKNIVIKNDNQGLKRMIKAYK